MMSPPLTAVTQQFVKMPASRAAAGWDHSAMVETLEQLANVDIDQKSAHEEHG